MVFGPIVILAGSLISIPLARRSPEAAVEYNKWEAFKKFMSDFSAMKEAGPSLLPRAVRKPGLPFWPLRRAAAVHSTA